MAILPPGNLCWVVLGNRENVLVKVLCENIMDGESNHCRVCNDSGLWNYIWSQGIKIHQFGDSFWRKQNCRKLFPLLLSLWSHSQAGIASAECTAALLEVPFRGVWFWGSRKVNSQESREHPLVRELGEVFRQLDSQWLLGQWLFSKSSGRTVCSLIIFEDQNKLGVYKQVTCLFGVT